MSMAEILINFNCILFRCSRNVQPEHQLPEKANVRQSVMFDSLMETSIRGVTTPRFLF